MAVTRRTLRLLHRLRVTVGAEADDATRALTGAWVTAWDEIAQQVDDAIADVVAETARLGRRPQPWELARIGRLQEALAAAEQRLIVLGEHAGVTVTDAASRVVTVTGEAEPHLIASQLPAAEYTAAAATFGGKLLPSALDAIVARTQARIVSETRILSGPALDGMRRSLITGIAAGDSPRATAADMVARVQGAFNGGLTRALTIARTEILDAYRTSSLYAHTANADVLDGWRWLATLDSRTCPACWSQNGHVYPVSTPGPWDHQNGRCARVPVTRSWSALGLHGLKEPPDLFPNAEATFRKLSNADQLTIMGPSRLALLQSGQVQWPDLARQRNNAGWRPSYEPTPVRVLTARAA